MPTRSITLVGDKFFMGDVSNLIYTCLLGGVRRGGSPRVKTSSFAMELMYI